MKTKIKKTPAITTPEPIALCRYCSSSRWGYAKTSTTEVDTALHQVQDTKITAREVRCLECGMKATKHDLPKILAMDIFKKIKEQETANV